MTCERCHGTPWTTPICLVDIIWWLNIQPLGQTAGFRLWLHLPRCHFGLHSIEPQPLSAVRTSAKLVVGLMEIQKVEVERFNTVAVKIRWGFASNCFAGEIPSLKAHRHMCQRRGIHFFRRPAIWFKGTTTSLNRKPSKRPTPITPKTKPLVDFNLRGVSRFSGDSDDFWRKHLSLIYKVGQVY